MEQWFSDAKLGIFIHWGIYAVDGVGESWSFFTGDVPHDEYMAQLDGFTASRYDPKQWADLFARSGAKYAVLTSKHHDGVALWDAPNAPYTVVRQTPAGRDLLAGYAESLRDHGLKVGFYFSHADWNHPDYPTLRVPDEDWITANRFNSPADGVDEDPARWEKFRREYQEQVVDLAARYRPDLLWFDGEWERTEEQWGFDELGDAILAVNPGTVFNGRIGRHADYSTPEQAQPITAPDGPWELCLTVNDSWGYQGRDMHHKSVGQLVRYFTETIGMGGNLLLDIGPRADGTITAEQTERLEGLGDWIAKHSDAVYGTRAGLPAGHHYGPSTLSADGRTLYLVCFDPPRETVSVRGLRTPIKRVTVLGRGTELPHEVTGGLGEHPGVQWIGAPDPADVDAHATVLAVELDGDLDLDRGTGRA